MKYALITGASTGLGKDFAYLLSKIGYIPILVARNAKKLQEVANDLEKEFGIKPRVVPTDLSLPGSAEKLYQKIQKLKLPIECLVNNAGYGLNGLYSENDFVEEQQMIQLNVNSLAELCHLFGTGMVNQKKGYILNVASSAAFQPGPFMTNYYATKAYVLSLSEGLAEEFKQYGVFVSCLCPGPTKTEFFDRAKMLESRLVQSSFLVMDSKEVAEIGVKGLFSGKVVVIPGLINRILVLSVRFTPRFLVRKIAKYLNKIN